MVEQEDRADRGTFAAARRQLKEEKKKVFNFPSANFDIRFEYPLFFPPSYLVKDLDAA